MTPVEEAIIETLRRSGPCRLDDIATTTPPATVGERYSSPLIGCRGMEGCCFTTRLLDLSDHSSVAG